MGTSYKPDGYSTVSPYLVVDDAARTIEFLERALDAVELRRFSSDDGRVVHAEVRVDDTIVMIGEGATAVPCSVHVYVPDVDRSYRRALDAGGTSVQEPVQRDDPDKRAGVEGPGGTTWWLATTME